LCFIFKFLAFLGVSFPASLFGALLLALALRVLPIGSSVFWCRLVEAVDISWNRCLGIIMRFNFSNLKFFCLGNDSKRYQQLPPIDTKIRCCQLEGHGVPKQGAEHQKAKQESLHQEKQET
jgi:hypothetical protein